MPQSLRPLDQERFISLVLLVPNVLLWLLHFGSGSDWEPVLFGSSCWLAGITLFVNLCSMVVGEEF